MEGWLSDDVRLDEAVEAKSDMTAARALTLLLWLEDGAGIDSDGGFKGTELVCKLIEVLFGCGRFLLTGICFGPVCCLVLCVLFHRVQ